MVHSLTGRALKATFPQFHKLYTSVCFWCKLPGCQVECQQSPDHLYFQDVLAEKLPLCAVTNHMKELKSRTHTIHVWYRYLHLVDSYGKCREMYQSHGWKKGKIQLSFAELTPTSPQKKSGEASTKIILGFEFFFVCFPIQKSQQPFFSSTKYVCFFG